MNKHNGLLSRIAAELGIRQGRTEHQNNFKARIVSSAIGTAATASLHDIREDGEPVTLQHLKSRIETLRSTYLSLYPELQESYIPSPDDLSSMLLHGGCIYHSQDRVTPSAHVEAQSGQVIFVRGAPLKQKVCVSGLGTYRAAENDRSDSSAASMLGLQRNTLGEYWEQSVMRTKLEPFSSSAAIEFLRTRPPFTRGYFTNQPDTDGRISLMRTAAHQPRRCYLYRFEDGKIFACQLPSWRTDGKEYLRIAVSILHSRGSLPPSVFHFDGETASLRLQYLWPPSELDMLKLYSWHGINPFGPYVMARCVFLALKAELERIGYTFIEE